MIVQQSSYMNNIQVSQVIQNIRDIRNRNPRKKAPSKITKKKFIRNGEKS